jgi:hypothetical protein
MFLWFVATAVLAVFLVFDSPAVDHRFVAAGALLPLVELITGHPWVLHTLAGSVALLIVVLAATIGRRLRRRRLLGLPIGALMFLVFSGCWSRTALFWWPLVGFDEIGTGTAPELDRPLMVIVLLELTGTGGLGWLWHRYDLGADANRRRLVTTGRLPARTGP